MIFFIPQTFLFITNVLIIITYIQGVLIMIHLQNKSLKILDNYSNKITHLSLKSDYF